MLFFCLNEICDYSDVIIIKKKRKKERKLEVNATLFDTYSAERSWY